MARWTAVCLCALGALSGTAVGLPSTFHHQAGCASAHSASFHAKCPSHKGTPHYTGPPAHILYFSARHGVCPDAGLAPGPGDLARVRAATLCLVNRERARHGEMPLHWNMSLVRSAQSHTNNMAYTGYFAHIGRSGETPLQRMRRQGYPATPRVAFEVGENIAWGSLWLGTPRAIVATWMASAGHRANILDRRYRDTGIGISAHLGRLAHGQRGGMYTQDFGAIVR